MTGGGATIFTRALYGIRADMGELEWCPYFKRAGSRSDAKHWVEEK